MDEDRLISDDELDALLAGRDPLDTARLDAQRLAPILTRLKHDIAGGSRVVPVRRRHVRRRVATLAGVGVGLAAAALAGVSLLGGGSTRSLLPSVELPAAQAAQLDRIAQATAAGSSAGHGKWLFVKLTTIEHVDPLVGNSSKSPGAPYSVTKTVQEWSASAYGPNRFRITFSNFAFASPNARAVYESHRTLLKPLLEPLPLAAGHNAVLDATLPRGFGGSSTDIGENGSQVPLSSLPSEPGALVKLLGRDAVKTHGPTGPLTPQQRRENQEISIDSEALRQWLGLSQILIASTSARQRAEAYRALTLVRFVHVMGKGRDSRGRQGIAVSFYVPGAGGTDVLIVDPKTGNLLQYSIGTGTKLIWLARASVDSSTQLPGGGTQLKPQHPSSVGEIIQANRAFLVP